MNLKLNLKGSVKPFANYLLNFAKIRNSLLLEIDTVHRSFVAKTFTEDHASVRFSSISFDECNMKVVSHVGEEKLGEDRIKTAILLQLPRLVQILERFGDDADEHGDSDFDIIVDYDSVSISGETNFVATTISFSSATLKMKMDGFRVQEFKYLSDEVFENTVFHVDNPRTFVLSPDTISSIVKTSEIIKIDPKKDGLTFFTKGTDVFVKDYVQDKSKQPNFIFKIGKLDEAPEKDMSMSIFRERFLQMLGKTDETFNVILGKSVNKVVDRLLFDSATTSTKVVISIIRESGNE